jgi:hypothetical protein
MLQLLANFSSGEIRLPGSEETAEETIFETMTAASTPDCLSEWGVRWTLQKCSHEADMKSMKQVLEKVD